MARLKINKYPYCLCAHGISSHSKTGCVYRSCECKEYTAQDGSDLKVQTRPVLTHKKCERCPTLIDIKLRVCDVCRAATYERKKARERELNAEKVAAKRRPPRPLFVPPAPKDAA